MPFNPSLPAASSTISSAELRGQFNGLQQNIQAKASEDECVSRLMSCAVNPTVVDGLGQVISNPPTQAEVQDLSNKLDELIAVLKRA